MTESRAPESPFRVMVVDDEALSRLTTRKQLVAIGYAGAAAESAEEVLERYAAGERWDLVLTDLRMPGMDGVELLRQLKELAPEIEVILMTAFGSIETAVQAMRLGATDYLTKPFLFDELCMRLERVRERGRERAELDSLRSLYVDRMGLVGSSEFVEPILHRVRTFGTSNAPVLITGETGTGKEVVSRAIHKSSERDGEFVAVGCGTIPGDLAESEFFGHERGAFTGASQRRLGRFEQAEGGTLLLDDVDDLPLDLQVKLLRVLQEGTIMRVGGGTEMPVDVRIVATTKVNLEELVDQGSFRPDLFYRLRGLEIMLPPLRDRVGDVPLLAEHFLLRCAAAEENEPKNFSPDALEVLERYPWPGNVRELCRAVESAAVLSPGQRIESLDLPDFLRRNNTSAGVFKLELGAADSVDFGTLTRSFESELIQWALERGGGRQTVAAKLLGLPRTTLQSKLRELDGA